MDISGPKYCSKPSFYIPADTSTLLETSNSSVALYVASSTESVGDLSLGEDFLSPRITSFRGAMSSFSIQTAGEGFMQMGDGHNLIIIIMDVKNSCWQCCHEHYQL